MENRTITVEYSGPSKKNNKFASIKTVDGAWLSAPIGMLDKFPKGATVEVVVEQNGQYLNIKGMAPANNLQQSGGGGKNPTQAYISACALIPKIHQGTGQFPGRGPLAQQYLDAMMAWDDAVIAYTDYLEGKSPDEAPF